MNEQRKGRWIQTWTGIAYYPADPRVREVSIYDIAHALAMQCRFGGHPDRFYSVAEHSVHVSKLVPPEHALDALMHDATEAYLIDLPRPLKDIFRQAGVTLYDELEALNWTVIAQRFRLSAELPECVKVADNRMLLAEKAQLRGAPSPQPWSGYGLEGLEPAPVHISALDPVEAERYFLRRFSQLIVERNKCSALTPTPCAV